MLKVLAVAWTTKSRNRLPAQDLDGKRGAFLSNLVRDTFMASYPVINFEQYDSGTTDDRLLVFAAPAKEIAQWAGIPRKGWHVRMLYQRWVTPSRERELTDFWTRASSRDGEGYILGPTALTIAVHGDPVIEDGNIHLDYRSPLINASSGSAALKTVAALVLPMIRVRLSEGQQEVLAQFMTDCCRDLPDAEHDYVLESAMQIGQMCTNPEWFIERHDLDENQVQDIIVALEALCRPALVVE